MGTFLTRDAILGAEDLGTEIVDVAEWGGSVTVRGMTGKERDAFEASILERRGKRMVPNTANVRAKLVARCCLDENGDRLFTDSDAEALGAKSGAAIDRVYEVAARLSGMTDEDIDELVEGFGDPTSADSSSSSPRS
jgi:hypothetical protein